MRGPIFVREQVDTRLHCMVVQVLRLPTYPRPIFVQLPPVRPQLPVYRVGLRPKLTQNPPAPLIPYNPRLPRHRMRLQQTLQSLRPCVYRNSVRPKVYSSLLQPYIMHRLRPYYLPLLRRYVDYSILHVLPPWPVLTYLDDLRRPKVPLVYLVYPSFPSPLLLVHAYSVCRTYPRVNPYPYRQPLPVLHRPYMHRLPKLAEYQPLRRHRLPRNPLHKPVFRCVCLICQYLRVVPPSFVQMHVRPTRYPVTLLVLPPRRPTRV